MVPLVALYGLVQLRIPASGHHVGRAGRRDQGGIKDRALSHRRASLAEMGFDGVKDRLTQLVVLQQVKEGQDRRFIRNPVADQVDPYEQPQGWYLDQCLLHGWITERVPMLQQGDSKHGGQQVRSPAALLAGLGVVGLDEINQRLRNNQRVNLRKKLLAFEAFLGRGQLMVSENELLAAQQLNPGVRSFCVHLYSRSLTWISKVFFAVVSGSTDQENSY